MATLLELSLAVSGKELFSADLSQGCFTGATRHSVSTSAPPFTSVSFGQALVYQEVPATKIRKIYPLSVFLETDLESEC